MLNLLILFGNFLCYYRKMPGYNVITADDSRPHILSYMQLLTKYVMSQITLHAKEFSVNMMLYFCSIRLLRASE